MNIDLLLLLLFNYSLQLLAALLLKLFNLLAKPRLLILKNYV